jgi:hypothetical protein
LKKLKFICLTALPLLLCAPAAAWAQEACKRPSPPAGREAETREVRFSSLRARI